MQIFVLQGKKNPGTDRNSVMSFLDQVKKAKEMKIDKLVNLTFVLSHVSDLLHFHINDLENFLLYFIII